LYCDVRLTKDGLGVCLPDIKMDNCTNIADFYAKDKKSYLVNGVSMTGWFSVDYNGTELSQVSRKCDHTVLKLPEIYLLSSCLVVYMLSSEAGDLFSHAQV
jgi:hypothetical protein